MDEKFYGYVNLCLCGVCISDLHCRTVSFNVIESCGFNFDIIQINEILNSCTYIVYKVILIFIYYLQIFEKYRSSRYRSLIIYSDISTNNNNDDNPMHKTEIINNALTLNLPLA